jgi:hypothetical protein
MFFGHGSTYDRSNALAARQGFALVVTLIMVVLAAVITVGLLTNSTFERANAASNGQRYQAEVAAQNGLEAAKQALFAIGGSPSRSESQNDDFVVVSANDGSTPPIPYYYIGCAEPPNPSQTPTPAPSPTMRYYPLYTGASPQPAVSFSPGLGPTPIAPPSLASNVVAKQTLGSNGTVIYYPKLFPSPAPHYLWQPNIRTQWQYVPTASPAPSPTPSASPLQYRYTYWIEDLAGYVDANVAGNTDGTGSTHIRSLGYDPKEEALFTLFPASPAPSPADADPGNTYASKLVASHPLLFTRLSTRLNTSSASPDDVASQSFLAANLQTDFEQSVIPFGMGYTMQGQPKTNLNSIITNTPNDTGITQIVKSVSDNMPTFASTRQGALTDGYLETIAANIIDYADSDSTPLVGTNAASGKNYRGIDLMPFVTEVYEVFYWDKGYYQQGTDYYIDIRVRTYINVWNMFSKDISTGTLLFNDKLAAGIQFGTSGGTNTFDTSKISNDLRISLDFSNLPNPPTGRGGTLVANESRPLLACERVYTFDVGSTAPADNKIFVGKQGSPSNSGDVNSSYEVRWNGVVYDRPGTLTTKALDRANFTIVKGSAPLEITGTVPALSSGYHSETAPFNLGDPRGSYYLGYTQWNRAYTKDSCWGGRIYLQTSAGGSSPYYAAETRILGWADGGHNSAQGVIPSTDPTVVSPSPLKLNGDPTTLTGMPTPEPSKAPARISNRSDGRLYSITELSYIYDPFQWNPFAATPTGTPAVDSGWQNTWKNKFKNFPTPVATDDGTYGSHSTLRIGRPEHKSFDQRGTRAWQLLDIFSAGDPSNSNIAGGTANQISTRGKINLNTATTDSLRALAAGIQIGNLNSGDVDQAIQPSTVYGPLNTKAADIFAGYVIAQRQKNPFISTSQLAALPGGNNEPFFGNLDQWPTGGGGPNGGGGPTEWNDAAAEQYFAKLYNFTTVRSRNFRVFITGQYVDPNRKDPYDPNSPFVIATANKVYEVFLKPTRNPSTGAITDQTCVVTYQADVP